jgi:DNA polymerase-3 subunit epsilon
MEVHGITNEFLVDKPLFSQIVDEFMTFVKGAELVIHNAPFDIGFLDHELRLDGGRYGTMADHCSVVDSLVMARQKHPGAKNNLDALCKRYMVDNSQRDLHGALLDAEILADVYLMMTGGQTDLMLGQEQSESTEAQGSDATAIRRLDANRPALAVIQPSAEELELHSRKLEEIQKASGECLWLK